MQYHYSCLSWITTHHHCVWNTCERKVKYKTKLEAENEISSFNINKPVAPYPCIFCGCWHYGSGAHALKPGLIVYFGDVGYHYHHHYMDEPSATKALDKLRLQGYHTRLQHMDHGNLRKYFILYKIKKTMHPKYIKKTVSAKKKYLDRCEKYGLVPYSPNTPTYSTS